MNVTNIEEDGNSDKPNTNLLEIKEMKFNEILSNVVSKQSAVQKNVSNKDLKVGNKTLISSVVVPMST